MLNFSLYYNYIKQLILPNNLKISFLKQIIKLEKWIVPLISLKNKYPNIKYFIGSFDAIPHIDYLTERLEKYQIKTICIPHGINFKYKVHYITLGTHIYTFWSNHHQNRIIQNLIYKDKNCKLIITGNPNVESMNKKFQEIKDKFPKKERTILIIGEYFLQLQGLGWM